MKSTNDVPHGPSMMDNPPYLVRQLFDPWEQPNRKSSNSGTASRKTSSSPETRTLTRSQRLAHAPKTRRPPPPPRKDGAWRTHVAPPVTLGGVGSTPIKSLPTNSEGIPYTRHIRRDTCQNTPILVTSIVINGDSLRPTNRLRHVAVNSNSRQIGSPNWRRTSTLVTSVTTNGGATILSSNRFFRLVESFHPCHVGHDKWRSNHTLVKSILPIG
ncbi:hypothetical protein ISN44_As12g033000 [Arabidopsis suecica]|uniref:Uncharacterized protein n=1 Tax=Arabidopsis suecica TaxID=45249 RepID=A0A8T1YPB8_ARASU|nr:hypothetical protein ISN44_As12g033000 [Arabidopsis suecica]